MQWATVLYLFEFRRLSNYVSRNRAVAKIKKQKRTTAATTTITVVCTIYANRMRMLPVPHAMGPWVSGQTIFPRTSHHRVQWANEREVALLQRLEYYFVYINFFI